MYLCKNKKCHINTQFVFIIEEFNKATTSYSNTRGTNISRNSDQLARFSFSNSWCCWHSLSWSPLSAVRSTKSQRLSSWSFLVKNLNHFSCFLKLINFFQENFIYSKFQPVRTEKCWPQLEKPPSHPVWNEYQKQPPRFASMFQQYL